MYGEGEHHLDQLGEAGSPLATGSRHGQGKGKAAGVVDGGKDVAAPPCVRCFAVIDKAGHAPLTVGLSPSIEGGAADSCIINGCG